MIDMKMLQQVGNLAAKSINNRYPLLDVRFFAMKEGSSGRVVILPKGDKSGRTSRLFELGTLPELDPIVQSKELTSLLTGRIEGAVKEFLQASEGSA